MTGNKYIIYFGHFELPDRNALAHRVVANTYLLNSIGYNVVLVGYSKSNSQVNKIVFPEITMSNPSYALTYPSSVSDWLRDLHSYKKIREILDIHEVDDCKAIFFTGVGIGNTAGLLKISKRYGIPLISDTVDWFTYENEPLLKRIYKKTEEYIINTHLKTKVKNIICISTYLKNYYDAHKCNTIVVPSLTYKADKRFSDMPAYYPCEHINICYAGNPGVKGAKDRLDWCIQAFCELNIDNTSLQIYGVTKDQFFKDYSFLLQYYDNEHIVFWGKVENKACVNAIAESDFFVFARENTQTTRAGFPTKFSESMRIGTPVVTTPSGDLKNYIVNGVNGYISKSCTYESFRDSLAEALSTSTLKRQELHQACNISKLDEMFWRANVSMYINEIIGDR